MLGLLWTLAVAADLPTDRVLDHLTHPNLPGALSEAAGCRWDRGEVKFSEIRLDRDLLLRLARSGEEPPLRVLREGLGRPVDPVDFVLFLDDLCVALESESATGFPWTVPSGRARAFGIFVHPKEVYADGEVNYGDHPVSLDPILDYRSLPRPPDGAPVGPHWARRYLEPESDAAKLEALSRANPAFASRVGSLIEQLRKAGALVYVESAVRSRHRGYLLYGSYWLGAARSEAQARARTSKLQAYNREWKLDVPINWEHPEGWRKAVEQAGLLADTYGVDYATVRGARRSRHYDGNAIDFVAVDLPRTLTLTAPDGKKRTFDLSAPEQTRDLSLTPELVDWVEAHFGIRKLRKDYPHWSDAS